MTQHRPDPSYLILSHLILSYHCVLCERHPHVTDEDPNKELVIQKSCPYTCGDVTMVDFQSELVAVMAGTQIDSILAQIKAKDWNSLADLKPFYEGIETTFAMPKVNYNDVTRASMRLKLPTTRLFDEHFIQANNKENTKAPHYCFLTKRSSNAETSSWVDLLLEPLEYLKWPINILVTTKAWEWCMLFSSRKWKSKFSIHIREHVF